MTSSVEEIILLVYYLVITKLLCCKPIKRENNVCNKQHNCLINTQVLLPFGAYILFLSCIKNYLYKAFIGQLCYCLHCCRPTEGVGKAKRNVLGAKESSHFIGGTRKRSFSRNMIKLYITFDTGNGWTHQPNDLGSHHSPRLICPSSRL